MSNEGNNILFRQKNSRVVVAVIAADQNYTRWIENPSPLPGLKDSVIAVCLDAGSVWRRAGQRYSTKYSGIQILRYMQFKVFYTTGYL